MNKNMQSLALVAIAILSMTAPSRGNAEDLRKNPPANASAAGKSQRSIGSDKYVEHKQSDAEMKAYMRGCQDALRKAKPKMGSKDIHMLCSDPYLTGNPKETADDKARRLRLIKETNEDKAKAMGDVMSKQEFIKECQQMIKDSDPGKDPADIKMMCENPYLTPQAGESSEDQIRRKRLIKEAEAAKVKAIESSVEKADRKLNHDERARGAQ
jgi:hypothetical protein